MPIASLHQRGVIARCVKPVPNIVFPRRVPGSVVRVQRSGQANRGAILPGDAVVEGPCPVPAVYIASECRKRDGLFLPHDFVYRRLDGGAPGQGRSADRLVDAVGMVYGYHAALSLNRYEVRPRLDRAGVIRRTPKGG